MCFSAESSFAASGVLLLSGAYCLRVTVPDRPACVPLALIPVIFGVQQAAEGLVWVGLAREDPDLIQRSALTFLCTAICFWPFWIPLSAAFLEARRWARTVLVLVAAVGLAFGIGLCAPFVASPDRYLEVGVAYHSIQYRFTGLPAFTAVPRVWWHAAYLMIVFSPFLVSPDRNFTWYCVLLGLSAAISHLVFWYAFLSVWCFFAALLSLQLCYTLTYLDKPKDAKAPIGGER
jgi:hypothetical protein